MNIPTLHPVVCGTDLSENAKQAANVAAALAKCLGVPLHLVHAGGLLLERTLQEICDLQRASIQNLLHIEAERLRALGTKVEETIVDGAPEKVLAQFAQERQAGLVIVASLGVGASTRWLLGSVAERTAESSPAPTLVVRDAKPFEAWMRGDRPLKVFVGTDFTTSSEAALRWVAELQRIGPLELVAGYVDWPPEEATRLGHSGSIGYRGNPPVIQDVLERDIREKVTRLVGTRDVRITVRGNWGRPDMPLIDMAVEAQADLIVVGTHQWHGLSRIRHGSVSRGILHHSPMSVACVPTPESEPMPGPRIRECRRVLVAVDLNEPHGFAAPHGYSLVQPGGCVCLVHNIPPALLTNPMSGWYDSEADSKTKHDQRIAEAETKLRALAPPEGEARGITTEVEVTEERDTAEAICAAAERFGADVICVGGHTRPGFTAKVLGSISLAVLQSSRRPVLVVWPPAE